jgi:hypothetical protein
MVSYRRRQNPSHTLKLNFILMVKTHRCATSEMCPSTHQLLAGMCAGTHQLKNYTYLRTMLLLVVAAKCLFQNMEHEHVLGHSGRIRSTAGFGNSSVRLNSFTRE